MLSQRLISGWTTISPLWRRTQTRRWTSTGHSTGYHPHLPQGRSIASKSPQPITSSPSLRRPGWARSSNHPLWTTRSDILFTVISSPKLPIQVLYQSHLAGGQVRGSTIIQANEGRTDLCPVHFSITQRKCRQDLATRQLHKIKTEWASLAMDVIWCKSFISMQSMIEVSGKKWIQTLDLVSIMSQRNG